MVKEALTERANLLQIAPHLAYPLPIMLPVYKYVCCTSTVGNCFHMCMRVTSEDGVHVLYVCELRSRVSVPKPFTEMSIMIKKREFTSVMQFK